MTGSRRLRAGLPLALVASSSLACGRGQVELRLLDTEGRRFVARCTREASCQLEQQAGPSELPGRLELWHSGKLVGVCALASGSSRAQASDCRPLVCDSDRDCPPPPGSSQGTCLGGLCVDPSKNQVTEDDAVMLCLAGTGLGRSSRLQVERYALAKNCGSPCRVPAPCRQLE